MIYHTDTDVKYFHSPDPYVEKFMGNSDLFFLAHCESRKRGWTGFNTHVMMLRPSRAIGKLMRLKAASGDFVATTNTEQDVIDSVFSPSTQCMMNPHTQATKHIHTDGEPVGISNMYTLLHHSEIHNLLIPSFLSYDTQSTRQTYCLSQS